MKAARFHVLKTRAKSLLLLSVICGAARSFQLPELQQQLARTSCWWSFREQCPCGCCWCTSLLVTQMRCGSCQQKLLEDLLMRDMGRAHVTRGVLSVTSRGCSEQRCVCVLGGGFPGTGTQQLTPSARCSQLVWVQIRCQRWRWCPAVPKMNAFDVKCCPLWLWPMDSCCSM